MVIKINIKCSELNSTAEVSFYQSTDPHAFMDLIVAILLELGDAFPADIEDVALYRTDTSRGRDNALACQIVMISDIRDGETVLVRRVQEVIGPKMPADHYKHVLQDAALREEGFYAIRHLSFDGSSYYRACIFGMLEEAIEYRNESVLQQIIQAFRPLVYSSSSDLEHHERLLCCFQDILELFESGCTVADAIGKKFRV
jgi:hypothetical protein